MTIPVAGGGQTIMDGQYRTSFSGSDIQAVVGTQLVGNLQAISYSITREKGPIYTMDGTPDPHAFARGKRAIGGSLIFVTYDEQAFLSLMRAADQDSFYGSKRSARYNYYNVVSASDLFGLFEVPGGTIKNDAAASTMNEGAGSERKIMDAWYADQVLPFDVNISAANSRGEAMRKSFIGVEIYNEGGGVSVDDLVLEEQYTYACRALTPWTKITDGSVPSPPNKFK